VATARAAEIRAGLSQDEVLLEYLVTQDRLHLFAVSAAGVRHIDTPVQRTQLEARVRLARELAGTTRGAAGSAGPLAGLYDVLIRPAERGGALGGARRLVVVPHGILSYLPFAALRNDSTGRWLVQDHSLVILPTASALSVLRHAAPAGSGRATVFAPFPDQLPATRGEATGLRAVLARPTVRLGGAASEARAREALAAGNLVHVASHGALDSRNPLFSRVALAPGRATSPDDDGRLEVHEILGLHVRSPLVFLSGCQTGLGVVGSTAYAAGEDYTTLAQAFLYAGAGGVVSTLWRIEDAGAAALAERFYRHLAGMAPPEALAAAQRDVLSQPRYNAPFYWAAYTFSGGGAAQNPMAVSVRP
jgi:CHAT domain-containing protein